MKLNAVIEGSHNKVSFRYDQGFINMFGIKWDYKDIQTLIETVNLLKLEGYTLKSPLRIEKQRQPSIFGGTIEIENKVYEEDI